MRKIFMFSLVFLLTAMIMGCGARNDGARDNANNRNAPVTEGSNNGINHKNDLNNNTPNTNNTERNIGNENTNANTKIMVADKVADRVVELEEVDTATVLITDHNAYVAVVLKSGTDTAVTEEVEKKIADKVREEDRNIQNVHVSSNPEFIERWTGFREKINAGEPVEGFFEEFRTAVENVFPHRR